MKREKFNFTLDPEPEMRFVLLLDTGTSMAGVRTTGWARDEGHLGIYSSTSRRYIINQERGGSILLLEAKNQHSIQHSATKDKTPSRPPDTFGLFGVNGARYRAKKSQYERSVCTERLRLYHTPNSARHNSKLALR